MKLYTMLTDNIENVYFPKLIHKSNANPIKTPDEIFLTNLKLL